MALFDRLVKKGVTISSCHRLLRVDDGAAAIQRRFTSATRVVPDATVVLTRGLVPDDRVASQVAGRVAEVHVVGDALAPRWLAPPPWRARVARVI